MRLEHIGIAVADAQEAQRLFNRLMGKPVYRKENVGTEKVTTYFYDAESAKLELLAATEEDSVITKFIDKRGEGVHHLAFEVNDIIEEVARLKSEGFNFINEIPKPGADNKLICFLHPKSTNGVLVELCQSIPK